MITKPKLLYHGTCKAFLAYAMQNNGNFGPSYDRISFTPDLRHARDFALSWQEERGRNRLKNYFGKGLEERLHHPVILVVKGDDLPELKYERDCGADEFYLKRGPINISKTVCAILLKNRIRRI